MNRIRQLIHRRDPYDAIHPRPDYAIDLQGWGSTSRVFKEVLGSVNARDILEVGTWKGASAIHMARLQQKLGRDDFEITCVDTWLGSVEFWLSKAMELVDGYPTVYGTFMHNVVASGMQPYITAFPVTSAIAARIFAAQEVQFDVIYIDADHSYEEVKRDLSGYWPLVRRGGIMFGDDYQGDWPSVIAAVDEFSCDTERAVEISDQKWIVRR